MSTVAEPTYTRNTWQRMSSLRRLLAFLCTAFVLLIVRLITAVKAHWRGSSPISVQRIYFANHTSNADFVLIWSALPERLRDTTRPVAGSDYWLKGAVSRFIARDVFGSVLIDRTRSKFKDDPLEVMSDALNEGASLILFPEGTRNMTDAPLLPFKSGLFHLAKRQPEIELLPVWLNNTKRVLPKGEALPVPLLCSVTFGAPLRLRTGENKTAFLQRAAHELLRLSPRRHLEAPAA